MCLGSVWTEHGEGDTEAGDEQQKQNAEKENLKLALSKRKGGVKRTTPIVFVEHASVESVKAILEGDKTVEKIEVRDGYVAVTFDRYKSARFKILSLHNQKSQNGTSIASFETELGCKERLIVRNLPFTATESMLRKAFEVHGPLKDVNMPMKHDGRVRGFR